MKKYFFLAIALAMALTLSACKGSKAEPTALPSVPAEFAGMTMPDGVDAAAGANLYFANCATCHGDTGLGDGLAGEALDPRPANLVALASQVGDDYLFWRINTGKEGTSMVAWKGILTEDEIWEVIAYIRSLK